MNKPIAKPKPVPMVYACSGCSNVAQLANDIAVGFDREGFAEMGCLTGVCAEIAEHVQKVKGARRIIAIDGCPLNCTQKCLGRIGITPTWHFTLTQDQDQKSHADFETYDIERVKGNIQTSVELQMEALAGADGFYE